MRTVTKLVQGGTHTKRSPCVKECTANNMSRKQGIAPKDRSLITPFEQSIPFKTRPMTRWLVYTSSLIGVTPS